MSFIKRIEEYDATHGIPRPADAEHLPPYHAFLRCVTASVEMLVLAVCGVLSCVFLSYAAGYIGAAGQVYLMFVAGMMMCLALALAEAGSLVMPYYRFNQRLTYGTARWADESYLRNAKLAKREEDKLEPGAIRIGKLKKGHELTLPVEEWLRHIAIFGPPGSGKSKTYLMNILRDVARGGSALVLDPKGELFEQTAHHFKRAFRLDLTNPSVSDRWNFLPQCKDNPEFAHQMAATMIGIEGTRHTVADPFWGEAELVALTAILLQLPLLVDEPTPPMVYEYTALRNDESFAADMMNSENHSVKLAWGAFTKAPKQTQGSVLTGLSNKLHPFLIKAAQAVTAPITEQERQDGVQQINFKDLQKTGTAIYIVIHEGDASRYKTFLSTFIGQAVTELRNENNASESAPVMFILDEAANVPLTGLKELAGVGRGRRMGLCLGYQNLPQMQDQYGHDTANAILGSIGTTIFLPGLDDATTQYASRRIGQTTAWSHTTVDGHGSKMDNERNSETGRALMDPTEVRQLVKHKQAVVVIDTSPPIKCSYPPYAMKRDKAVPYSHGVPKPVSLIEAEEMRQARLAREASGAGAGDPSRPAPPPVTLDDAILGHAKTVFDNYEDLTGKVHPANGSQETATPPPVPMVDLTMEPSTVPAQAAPAPKAEHMGVTAAGGPLASKGGVAAPQTALTGTTAGGSKGASRKARAADAETLAIVVNDEAAERELMNSVTSVVRESTREHKRTVKVASEEVAQDDHDVLNAGRDAQQPMLQFAS